MNIQLPADLEERARTRVAAGEYATIEDVVRAGLDVLDMLETEATAEPDDWLALARERWAEADEVVERGKYFEGTPDELMARIRERIERTVDGRSRGAHTNPSPKSSRSPPQPQPPPSPPPNAAKPA